MGQQLVEPERRYRCLLAPALRRAVPHPTILRSTRRRERCHFLLARGYTDKEPPQQHILYLRSSLWIQP